MSIVRYGVIRKYRFITSYKGVFNDVFIMSKDRSALKRVYTPFHDVTLPPQRTLPLFDAGVVCLKSNFSSAVFLLANDGQLGFYAVCTFLTHSGFFRFKFAKLIKVSTHLLFAHPWFKRENARPINRVHFNFFL